MRAFFCASFFFFSSFANAHVRSLFIWQSRRSVLILHLSER